LDHVEPNEGKGTKLRASLSIARWTFYRQRMREDRSNDAIPAATVVVMREQENAPPRLLMLERAAAMRFAGGAMVFPGGRVDPGDEALAAQLGLDLLGAAKFAAMREAIEEAGVAIGFRTAPDAAELARVRGMLHGGAALGEVVTPDALDLRALTPFARWVPRGVTHKIFDTHFFLARMPENAPEPVVDATENSRLAWMTAAEVLAAADAGAVTIIFPTRRNLERLARFASFEEALADAAARPIRAVTPWVETRAGVEHLCIPDDLGYPVTAEPMRAVRRS
jgi:8-oxo-dGTP pyrophosphatase MutT (NUDIX family)